jgi:hypothetical protein
VNAEELIADLEALSADVAILQEALSAEFDAIKAQDLDQLDSIQLRKENALQRLSDGRFLRAMTALESDALAPGVLDKWQQLKDAAELGHEHLKRNELMIQRKLLVLREALQSLYQTDQRQGVQLYDRLGKLSGGARLR